LRDWLGEDVDPSSYRFDDFLRFILGELGGPGGGVGYIIDPYI
jgi:hypothetical protein